MNLILSLNKVFQFILSYKNSNKHKTLKNFAEKKILCVISKHYKSFSALQRKEKEKKGKNIK